MVATRAPQANGRHEPATSPAPAVPEYVVRSLAVAAALRCAGAVYLGPVAGADNWVEFRFADPAGEVRQLVGRYWRGQMEPVQPHALLGALIALRGEMAAARTAAKGQQTAGTGGEGGR